MAEEEEDAKTEAPSGRRLQQAWDDGQLPMGHDVVAAAALTAGVVAMCAFAPTLVGQLTRLCAYAAMSLREPTLAGLPGRMLPLIAVPLAIVSSAALAGMVGTVVQTKGGFWPHLAMPDLTRLFSTERLSRIFSKQFFSELGLSIVKVVAIGYVAYDSLRDDFVTLPRLLFAPTAEQLSATFGPLARASVRTLTTLALLAGLELALTRRRYRKKMMMTKEEAKRENRDDEGDPLIRSKRRRKHRELSRAQVSAAVPKADALVVNPTHIAIAIRYRKDESAAPRVLAKGKGMLAEKMRELAHEHGIPIVQDIPLARLLYKKVKVGKQVPAETFKAVAAVLAFVYRMTRSAAGGRR